MQLIAQFESTLLNSVLCPVAVLLVELPLYIVYIASICVSIMEDIERSDNAVIRSWLAVGGYAFPDQKNLLSEALYIVTVFHGRVISDLPPQRGLK